MTKFKIGLIFLPLLLIGGTTQAQAQGVGNSQSDAKVNKEEPKSNITQPCFTGDNSFGCTIRADNDPLKIGASKPATFAYTLNNDGKDSVAIEAAVKSFFSIRDASGKFLTLSGLWHKNNQQTKEQDNVNVGIGVVFESNSGLYQAFEASRNQEGPLPPRKYFYADTSFDLSYNRKASFGDVNRAECVNDPDLLACGRQNLETARIAVTTSPYSPRFESHRVFEESSSTLYWVLSPVAGIFYDEVLNDGVETYAGSAASGGVLGANLGLNFSISPGVFDNKWVFQLSGQVVELASQSDGRKEDFEKSTSSFSASLSYALGNSFIGDKAENKLIPALTLTYTTGSDPLKGRDSQNTLVAGLSLKY